jgi:hypothetical protein
MLSAASLLFTVADVAAAESRKTVPNIEAPHGMKPYAEVGVEFATALVNGDFARAHGLLAPELRAQLTPDGLRERLYRMFRGYSDGEPREVWFDEEFQMDDWPDKRTDDVGWAYVSITGDNFVEAVTVIVAKVDGGLFIRNIEWGRP